jgi:hypothetical protein
MKCLRPLCPRVGTHQGLCNPHRQVLVASGLIGHVSPQAAIDHLTRLHDLSWPNTAIAEKAGLAPATLRGLPHASRLLRATERAVLSVPLVRYRSPREFLPAVGLRRRYEALAWMGWPLRETAGRAGRTMVSFYEVMRRGTVTLSYLEGYAAVYDELNSKEGPSKRLRVIAKTRGFHPPAAWDDRDIDDPKAQPLAPWRSREAA